MANFSLRDILKAGPVWIGFFYALHINRKIGLTLISPPLHGLKHKRYARMKKVPA